MVILVKGCLKWSCQAEGQKRRLGRRFMDVVIVGVREVDAEDRVRWKQMIHCGNS